MEKFEEFKKTKDKELKQALEEKALAEMKLGKKEKELEIAVNALQKARKENKNLMAKVDVDTQMQDYHHVKGQVCKLQQENSELKNEVKGLKGRVIGGLIYSCLI